MKPVCYSIGYTKILYHPDCYHEAIKPTGEIDKIGTIGTIYYKNPGKSVCASCGKRILKPRN